MWQRDGRLASRDLDRFLVAVEWLEPRRCLSAVVPFSIRARPQPGQHESPPLVAAVTADRGPDVVRRSPRTTDTAAPRVVGVTLPAARLYPADASIRIGLRFSAPVKVEPSDPVGLPSLPMTVMGRSLIAPLRHGAGTRRLTFTLSVPAGIDGPVENAGPITLPPGTVLTDATGREATLDLPTNVATTLRQIHVDGVAPRVVEFGEPALNASGRAVTIVARTSEPVQVRGVPVIRALVGGTLRSLRYVSGTGTDRLSFAYRSQKSLQSSSIVPEFAIRLDAQAAIRDRAGNAYRSTGSVEGDVTRDGGAASEETMHLLDGLTLARVRSTTTNEHGHYAFEAAPSGRYIVVGEGSLGGVTTPVNVMSGGISTVNLESLGNEVFDPIAIDSRPCCEPGVGVYVIDDPADGRGIYPIDMQAAREGTSAIVNAVRDAGDLPYRVVNRISGLDARQHVDFVLFVLPWANTYRLVSCTDGRILDAKWIDETPLTEYLTSGILEHLDLSTAGDAPAAVDGTDTFHDLAGGPHHRHVATTSSELFLGGLLVYGAFEGRHGILFGRESDAVIERVTIVAEDYTGVDVDGRPGTTVVFLGCDALGVWQKVEVGVVRPNAQAEPGVVIDSAQHGLVRVEAVVLISYEAIFRSLTFHGKERCHVVARPSQDVV